MEDNKMDCAAVLFDLDGVLIDSSQCITRHWQTWAEQHGLDLEEIMQVAHGMRSGDTMRLVAPHLDIEVEEKRYMAMEETDHDGVTAIAGAGELLTALPRDAWAVVTSGSLALAQGRLAHVSLPVPDVLVTADDVKEGKPSPEPYLVGAKRLGVRVEDCVVIEDAPAGIRAGKSAGMRVIGVATTHTKEVMLKAGADVVTGRLSDLKIRGIDENHNLEIEIG